ncbi:MAG: hypothetical protein AAB573_02180 [Patescibacteria group bacterium]
MPRKTFESLLSKFDRERIKQRIADLQFDYDQAMARWYKRGNARIYRKAKRISVELAEKRQILRSDSSRKHRISKALTSVIPSDDFD